MKYQLTFACGATMIVKTPWEVGKRLVTYTSPHQGHQRPVPPDHPELRMQCLFMCPVGVRRSGRKVMRGWFEEPKGNSDNKLGFLVKCKVVECEECQ